ncbi:inositol monophosphatase [Candidatus Dependentiae bacterium]|nr:inositol monophosphatase [Candidatus Dependentiae bacterium]
MYSTDPHTIVSTLAHTVKPVMNEAGSLLLFYFNTTLNVREKKKHGLVTQADIEAELFLIEELGKIIPHASFFAEESGRSGLSTSEYCWVIDPLDGTTNFIHRLPYFCISVALTHNDVPIWGGIYVPITQEFFYAYQDGPAYCNGRQIVISDQHVLEKSVIVVGLPYVKDEYFTNMLDNIRRIAPKTYAFRHLGAAALDTAYVASGRLDGMFFTNLSWWDIAAGLLIIKQAGGIVTDFQGNFIDKDYQSFVAAGPETHKQLLVLLQG